MVKIRKLFAVLIVMMMTIAAVVPYTAKAVAYSENDYKEIYNTETATLSGMPVYMSGTTNKVNDELTFTFYDTTAQVYGPTVKSVNGVLADVELIKGHDYMITLADSKYRIENPIKLAGNAMYIMLDNNGNKAISEKRKGKNNPKPTEAIYVKENTTPITDPKTENRRDVEIVFWDENGDNVEDLANTKVKLVSEFEEITGVIDDEANLNVKLLESMNYMLVVEHKDYKVATLPITIKDHSEQGNEKKIYHHVACSPADFIIASTGGKFVVTRFGKGFPEKLVMKPIQSIQKDVTVEGIQMHYQDVEHKEAKFIINSRELDKSVIPNMGQRDYKVLDIDAINMYRTEICKLALGDYIITTNIPKDKKVKAVWNADKQGKLTPVNSFEQKDTTLKFNMNTLSLYNTVVEYQTDIYVATKESENQIWSKDAADGPIFTFKLEGEDGSYTAPTANVNNLKSVRIDDNKESLKENTDYTKRQGSIIVELTKAYADKLTPGEHTLTAVFEGDKEVTVNFNVKEANKPDGNDNLPVDDKVDNDKVDNEKVDKVDNTKIAKNNSKVVKAKSVSTSDSFNVAAYIIVGIIALISIGLICAKRRKI